MKIRRDAGLTLVELLIALALLGFVLLGITPLFMASVKSNYAGNEYTSINMLARDRLEQLMNLPFNDGQITPGKHGNDLSATLPDPITGLPAAPGPESVKNPFSVCYLVFQYQIPTSVATNASFTPILVTGAGQRYQYRRIEVTVTSATGGIGIGTRMARVSGVLSNPFPESNLSVADPGGSCP
jgi:prepilin-type N-terminal cleavage/methylation domain-containing protein